MKKINYLAIAALLGVVACGGAKNEYVKKGKVLDVIDQEANQGGLIESIGIGAADQALASQTQRRALSRDAAIVKAQYEMLSMVKGVEIVGGITVARAIEQDSTLESRIKETIKGAEIRKTEFTADDGAVVTMQIPKKRLESMMGVKFK